MKPQEFAELISEIRIHWSSLKGLLIALFLVGGALYWSFTSPGIATRTSRQWIASGLVLMAVVLVWFFTSLPRIPRGKVGFAVGILFEDKAEARNVQTDFVARLRELIQGSERLRHKFHFLELNRGLSRRFVESEERLRLATRMNCHFVIFGHAKLRNVLGGPSYVIESRGLVRHAEAEAEIKKRFAEEFSELWPSRYVVRDPDSLLAFEFAARHVDVVARYLIGVASAISRDLRNAEDLLLDCQARLGRLANNGGVQPLAGLRSKVAVRLSEIYDMQLANAAQRYTLRRDMAALREIDGLLVKRRAQVPDDYETRQSAALCAFLLHRDIPLARREYEACRGVDDASWRYGEAFLSGYEADLDSAYRWYRDAISAPLSDETVPIQCEEFIQIVLETEPQRYWLGFCLGLINYRAKGDLVAARRDLMAFLDRAKREERFPNQVRASREWIREIDASLVQG